MSGGGSAAARPAVSPGAAGERVLPETGEER
ncbi:hypothetical protein SAMN05216275_103196 [Streptosporangium canum]|uniref:Uncharacterized protein n=1 Tax=Streptosporangium canum TaxID=324952 RepID=A0A1I3I9S2_9ACTN|nr:hypothetical protein SAMN05216275_103196 [Streptosporangium canum]